MKLRLFEIHLSDAGSIRQREGTTITAGAPNRCNVKSLEISPINLRTMARIMQRRVNMHIVTAVGFVCSSSFATIYHRPKFVLAARSHVRGTCASAIGRRQCTDRYSFRKYGTKNTEKGGEKNRFIDALSPLRPPCN